MEMFLLMTMMEKFFKEANIKMENEVILYPSIINPYNYVKVRPRVVKKKVPGSKFGLTYNELILEPVFD